MNGALLRFEALYVVPIFQVGCAALLAHACARRRRVALALPQSFWILVSVISGMIFFREYTVVFSRCAPLPPASPRPALHPRRRRAVITC